MRVRLMVYVKLFIRFLAQTYRETVIVAVFFS